MAPRNIYIISPPGGLQDILLIETFNKLLKGQGYNVMETGLSEPSRIIKENFDKPPITLMGLPPGGDFEETYSTHLGIALLKENPDPGILKYIHYLNHFNISTIGISIERPKAGETFNDYDQACEKIFFPNLVRASKEGVSRELESIVGQIQPMFQEISLIGGELPISFSELPFFGKELIITDCDVREIREEK